MRVYLAGGMTDCTDAEMRGWREKATQALRAAGFDVLSPLRGTMGAAGERAEFYRDVWDIKNSDLLLVYLNGGREKSTGTLMEMQCAWDHGKYIVAILDDRHDHLFTREVTSYRALTLDEALGHIIESFERI